MHVGARMKTSNDPDRTGQAPPPLQGWLGPHGRPFRLSARGTETQVHQLSGRDQALYLCRADAHRHARSLHGRLEALLGDLRDGVQVLMQDQARAMSQDLCSLLLSLGEIQQVQRTRGFAPRTPEGTPAVGLRPRAELPGSSGDE